MERDSLLIGIIDDDTIFTEVLGMLLELEGYRSVACARGADALPFVARERPDVLLLDVEMPGMSGVEVASRLRASGSPVRILALSAYDDEEYINGMLASGAAAYLTKEEALERIAEAVRGVARGEVGWLMRFKI